jgi:MFS family permease
MSALAREAAGSARRPRYSRLAAGLGGVGAALGLVAGLVELSAGPSLRSWVGDKSDTTRLGIATIVLCAIALAAVFELAHRPNARPARRCLLAIAILVPGLICFTTVGRLSYAPGSLLASAGMLVLADLRGTGHELSAAAGRNWTALLAAVLGCFMVFLGATALGAAGALGIAGGLVVVGLIASRGKLALGLALPLLAVAVIPFVGLTWWSVATPLIGALALTLGTLALCAARRTARDGPTISTRLR